MRDYHWEVKADKERALVKISGAARSVHADRSTEQLNSSCLYHWESQHLIYFCCTFWKYDLESGKVALLRRGNCVCWYQRRLDSCSPVLLCNVFWKKIVFPNLFKSTIGKKTNCIGWRALCSVVILCMSFDNCTPYLMHFLRILYYVKKTSEIECFKLFLYIIYCKAVNAKRPQYVLKVICRHENVT